MLPQLPAAVRVFLCVRTDGYEKKLRRSFGHGARIPGQDPLSGHLFLFLNRRRDRVKILFWEPDGLVIFYTRLEGGTFQNLDPAAGVNRSSGQAGLELTTTDLTLLLTGIDVTTAKRRKRFARAI